MALKEVAVFGVPISSSVLLWPSSIIYILSMVRLTWNIPHSISMSFHFNAHISPILIPVNRQMYIPKLLNVKFFSI